VKAFALAGMEIKRFMRSRLTAAALAVLAVVPLLYGALYLYAFWDPYGRLNHIPAALVVEDRPPPPSDGTKVHAGQDLADELERRQVFDWHVTDEKAAEKGLADGKYQIMLRIPADFSANLARRPTRRDTRRPRSCARSATTPPTTCPGSSPGPRSTRCARPPRPRVGQVLRPDADRLHRPQAQTQQAADGAAKIDNGLGDAGDGAGSRERHRPGARRRGAARDRARPGGQGASDLVDGLAQAERGAPAARDRHGAGRRAAGRQLATAVDGAADKIVPVLRDNAQDHSGRGDPGGARGGHPRREHRDHPTRRPTRPCTTRSSCRTT
jgi:putative membrane protein